MPVAGTIVLVGVENETINPIVLLGEIRPLLSNPSNPHLSVLND